MDEHMTFRDAKKNPATIEREIDQTRAEMNKTLDALEQKLTAGQLLDQCLSFFGKTGREVGTSVGRSFQENPIPLMLTATGIVWMMRSSSAHNTPASTSGDRVYGAATEKLSHVRDQLKSGASSAQDQLTRSKDAVKDAMHDTAGALKERASSTASIAQTQARRVQERFNSTLEEQPLVLGAIGVAIGAAIGAMLPATEQEDRLMGQARDKMMEKGKEIGTKTYEKGREAANEAVGKATRASDAEPAPSGIREL
jgi:hypothetical protein